MRRREGNPHRRLDRRSDNNATPNNRERRERSRSIELLDRHLKDTGPHSPPSRKPSHRSRSSQPSRKSRTDGPAAMRSEKNTRQREQQQQQQQHENRPRPGRSTDPVCPFDANGYCVMHPDVQMAKRKNRGGWNMILEMCPKCCNNRPVDRRKISGDTESMSSEDSRDRNYHHRQHHHPANNPRGRGRTGWQSNNARPRSIAKNHRQSRDNQLAYERRRSRSFVNDRRRNPRQRQGQGNRSNPDDYAQHHYARNNKPPPPRRRRDERWQEHHGRREQQRHNNNDAPPDPPTRAASVCSRRSRSRSLRRSLSRRSSRRKNGEQRQHQPQRQLSEHHVIPVKRNAPFDKHGRCFDHPHVKLASKKMLGGWKIHMEFCPLCLRDKDGNRRTKMMIDKEQVSIISGMSRLTDGSGFTHLESSHRSSRERSHSSHASVSSHRSKFSLSSMGSFRSNMSSTNSWSTGRSSKERARKKKGKDETFLPLDEDGYCKYHPQVQLAKMSKKGGLKILMDFCPECAGDSLVVRGSKSRSQRGGGSVASSAASTCKSAKSDMSSSSFIESMPYIDGDGKPGHYTGRVDSIGQPTGRGEMKYVNGARFDGVWHEGTKLHGKTSKRSSKNGTNISRNDDQQRSRGDATPSPSTPPPPRSKHRHQPSRRVAHPAHPPMHSPLVRPPRNRPTTDRRPDDSTIAGEYNSNVGSHQSSRQDDMPSRESSGEGETVPSISKPRCNLSRLRRKCDEIETLLKGCPTSPECPKL